MPVEPTGPVIVAVDGSMQSLAAVDLAAEEAMGRVTPLLVVHGDGGRDAERAMRFAAIAAARARSEHPGLCVSPEVVGGDLAAALVTRAEQACLLVMRHGGLAGQVIGRVPVPVVVHRPVDESTVDTYPRPVVVGVAALAGSDAPIGFAFAEAALRGTWLFAVHVWSRPADLGPAYRDYDYARARDHAERMLAEAVGAWSDKYPDVQASWTTKHNTDVPAALAAVAHSAQLLVVGHAPHVGASRPVPAALIPRAGCPVAVVPTT
jgi:nucleotide-binding universal stress UspA family protein